LVIAKNKEDNSGKLKEAKSLGIPIMSVDEFTQIYIK
jgi:NAD-dependent DNA ligase